jgi:hypothetical protein
MPFVKGDPNINRTGRPKNSESEATKLRNALWAVENRKGKWNGVNFWDRVAEVAYEDTKVMVAIVKKFVPDKTHLSSDGPLIINKMQTVVINGEPLEYNIGNSRATEDTGHTDEADSTDN